MTQCPLDQADIVIHGIPYRLETAYDLRRVRSHARVIGYKFLHSLETIETRMQERQAAAQAKDAARRIDGTGSHNG